MPRRSAQTLGRRHNDVVDILNKQKKNEYSYKELATVFWNLGECESTGVSLPNSNFLFIKIRFVAF